MIIFGEQMKKKGANSKKNANNNNLAKNLIS